MAAIRFPKKFFYSKASGGDGIPDELFQILKDDAVSAELNMPENMENSAVATGLENVSFHSNPKERQCQRMLKLLHNVLISHNSKVMLRIFQARLQQYVNCELPDAQAGFRKSRGLLQLSHFSRVCLCASP